MQFIIGLFARPMGFLLAFLYDLVGIYGVSIIIFTILVRLCLFPLYASQIKHTVKMADMQSKITELQRKYARDKELMNEKLQELYQKEKFNPMMGCLPMLIQMPIILGLFALLRDPLIYMTDNAMIMAVHESFLWVSDLSQPDSWILPILAALATFVSFSQSQAQQTGADGANSAQGMMKAMKYFFPVMIFLMGRSFPSGLTVYWAVGNLIQIIQNRILNVMREKAREKARKEKEKEAQKKKK